MAALAAKASLQVMRTHTAIGMRDCSAGELKTAPVARARLQARHLDDEGARLRGVIVGGIGQAPALGHDAPTSDILLQGWGPNGPGTRPI